MTEKVEMKGTLPSRAQIPIQMSGRIRGLVTILLLIFELGVRIPQAQVDQGTITGVIADTTGAVVPKASIDVLNVGTGRRLHANADANGMYTFPPLPVGTYDVTASAGGFASTTMHSVEVRVDQRLPVNLTLNVGAASQSVQVFATDVPLLQTQDASVAQVLSSATINNTPLNGRNYTFIAQLTPGVAPATSSGSRGQSTGDFDANGQRPEQNNYVLDGIDNNSTAADLLNSTSYTIRPPPDALSEFRIQTISYDAQLGHSSGAVINAAIKTGTNSLHGDLWEYFRNDALNARQFNAQSVPAYHQNQFGATIGGPMIRNRLFFFGDGEANRIISGNPVFVSVPTPLMRAGNFSELLNATLTGQQPVQLYEPGSGGTAPLSCNGNNNVFCAPQLSAVAQNILSLYPVPNTNNGRTYNNYTANQNTVDNTVQWDGKLNWNASEKDQAFSRVSYSNDRGNIPPPLGPVLDGSSFGGDNLASKVEQIVLSETHTFSPTISNEFRLGESLMVIAHTQLNRDVNHAPALGLGGIPYGPNNGGLPAVSISGISGFGSPTFYPALQHDNIFQILDNVTTIHNGHSLRFGADFERVRFSYLEIQAPRGTYSYNGLYTSYPGKSFTGYGVADFIADYQNSANLSQLNNVDHLHWYMAGYAQDDWNATRRLVLNIGLRYDYYQPYLEIRDRQANLIVKSLGTGTGTASFLLPMRWINLPLATSFYSIAAQDNIAIQFTNNRGLSNSSKTQLSPRVGISYRVADKLVIRAGFGMFYGGLENTGGTLGQQYPFESTSSYIAPTCTFGSPCHTNGLTLPVGFANLAGPGPQSPVSLPTLVGKDANYRDGYSEQWNLMTQYAVSGSVSATIGYVGSLGRRMHLNPTSTGFNAPAVLAAPGVNTKPYSAFPQLGTIVYNLYEGTTSYHGLQAALEKRFTSGLSFLASYTYSHSLDNGDSGLGDTSFRNLRMIPLNQETANSDFDTRQRVTFNGSYDLPFGKGRQFANTSAISDLFIGGWSAALTFAAQSGSPISITPNITTAAGGNAFAFKVGDPFKGGGRPNATNPSIACPGKVRNLTNWYNPCAFANPVPGNQITGTVTSNAISYLGPPRFQTYGPGYNNTNVSLFKDFRTFKEQRVQFRVDAFNVFNTPAYGTPSALSDNSSSGFITAARSLGAYTPDARFFQLALKYSF
jgi:Carboxypeptidase regulatory-like domain